ncbi:hypothetical protein Taro_045459 [Colocasia esculenta]|uniref:Uncharacterized protein n=1 Tax=Colocasia esculenta TaxID=4460 RepID=A0A843WRD0_COLES|nr:hypothetical protein [Colocasia esculenta]
MCFCTDLIRRQGPSTPRSCLASIDHAADPESVARDRHQVPQDRTPWLPVDDMEVCQLATTSRGVRSGAEQQAPAPQGPVLPPPPSVDYGVFMQGLVQAMQTQAHTQAALQAQLEAQERADV